MTLQADPKRSPNTAILPIQAQKYMPGFGNDFETEALPDALPQGMNSPQKCNLRPVWRATFRHRIYRSHRPERAQLVLPNTPLGQTFATL